MGNKKLLFNIYTLGCKVNQCDSAEISRSLRGAGFKVVEKNAAWTIVNSCAVTATAIRKTRQMIAKARRENPEAKIVLSGCWPSAYWSEAKKNSSCAYFFKVNERKKIVNLIVGSQGQTKLEPTACACLIGQKIRYFLKVQDGCQQFCTYCLVPYVRSRLWSKPIKQAVLEVKSALQAGAKEIVISGTHLGWYGKDKKDKKHNTQNLTALVKAILAVPGLPRLRLSSLEPNEVSDELLDLVKKNHNFCPFFHLPLQAGSDRVLKAMGRPYSAQEYIRVISRIRKKIPLAAVSADIIVGFPGETEKDFTATLSLVKKIKFSRLHVFPFSTHEKTAASRFPEQIDNREIKKRADIIRRLGLASAREYQNKFINRSVQVLIEKKIAGAYIGKSEYYFNVPIKAKGNKLVKSGDLVIVPPRGIEPRFRE